MVLIFETSAQDRPGCTTRPRAHQRLPVFASGGSGTTSGAVVAKRILSFRIGSQPGRFEDFGVRNIQKLILKNSNRVEHVRPQIHDWTIDRNRFAPTFIAVECFCRKIKFKIFFSISWNEGWSLKRLSSGQRCYTSRKQLTGHRNLDGAVRYRLSIHSWSRCKTLWWIWNETWNRIQIWYETSWTMYISSRPPRKPRHLSTAGHRNSRNLPASYQVCRLIIPATIQKQTVDERRRKHEKKPYPVPFISWFIVNLSLVWVNGRRKRTLLTRTRKIS